MALYPLWLQNVDYPARVDRTLFDTIWTEGVIGAGDLAVTQSSPTAMTVDVAAGYAVVQGDDQVKQGKYLIQSDAVATISIAAAPGSGQRNDLIVLRVNDPNATGPTGDDAQIVRIAGTASSTPVDPAIPATALALARVRVPAGTGAITNSLIDDLRPRANANFDSLPAGSVTSAKIADGTIMDVDVNASAAIGLSKLATGNLPSGIKVLTANLDDGAVTSAKIEDGTIVDADVNASAAIALSKLATGTVPSGLKINAANFANNVIPDDAVFTIPGTLTTGAKNVRFYFETARTIANVVVGVSTAPTGASAIFDVNKNGTTIFTTQANRPTIAASSFYDGSSVPDVTSIAPGDYLTIDVDQIGSSVAGADAVVRIVFSA